MITISGFYNNGIIYSTRKSGTVDTLPIILPDKYNESNVTVVGNIISRNTIDRHTKLSIAPDQILPYFDEINEVKIRGFICRSPLTRTTPAGKTITNLLIAENDSYLPCIYWGTDIPDFRIGQLVELEGRFQSREYVKNGVTHKTHEISLINK